MNLAGFSLVWRSSWELSLAVVQDRRRIFMLLMRNTVYSRNSISMLVNFVKGNGSEPKHLYVSSSTLTSKRLNQEYNA